MSRQVARCPRCAASYPTTHFGIGPANFWRVFVRAADEGRAQEILDVEIGREEDE